MDLVTSGKDLVDRILAILSDEQAMKPDITWNRILAILSDEQVSRMWAKKNAVWKEEVAKLVEDTYRKMQVSGATDLASNGQVLSDSSNVKFKEDLEDSYNDMKIRCLCGSAQTNGTLLKCDDLKCQTWQHVGCVIIPEKTMEDITGTPDPFYCEICRLSRADPFWVAVGYPLIPVKLTSSIPTDGTNRMQSVKKTFHLTRADRDMVSKAEYDVQAWCTLLNDEVSFRMQWPQYAELQVNGMAVPAINRPGSQLLGANGRDDGPVITPCTKDGINKISLTGCDARIFCLGVRIVKRRTVQQILSLIPKESDGERFEDALARVRRCIGGGGATDNADSDSDLEVVADFFTVNLRCPMSGSRMKVAGRFKPCAHMGCFDLEIFVEMNQRSRKWQCPICLKNYSLENLIIDPYFNRITSWMQSCGEDVTEIQVKPDGCWRVKPENGRGILAQWYTADGEFKPKMDVLEQIKHDRISECHSSLKLHFKNCNGVWVLIKPNEMNTLTCNRLQKKFEDPGQQVIPISSSATGSGGDGEDPSVNQDGGGNYNFSTNPGIELDSISLNIDNNAYAFPERNTPAPMGVTELIVLSDSEEENDTLMCSGTLYNNSRADVGVTELIVLSDSEEENDTLMSSGTLYNNSRADAGGINFSIPTGIPDSYAEDPTAGPGLGLFSTADDDFGMSGWSVPPGTQPDPGYQFFVSDPLTDLQHNPINSPTSMNGYTLGPEAVMGSAALVPDPSIGRTDTDMNDGLVDNPLAFGGDDPSLQIFLPTRPSDASVPTDLRNQADVSNGSRPDDWISLRLGGSSGGHVESPAANGLNTRQQLPFKDGDMDSLADTASLLLGMNDGRSDKTSSRQRSDSPFSFPRQRRSVRPRLYLSIDSDSE